MCVIRATRMSNALGTGYIFEIMWREKPMWEKLQWETLKYGEKIVTRKTLDSNTWNTSVLEEISHTYESQSLNHVQYSVFKFVIRRIYKRQCSIFLLDFGFSIAPQSFADKYWIETRRWHFYREDEAQVSQKLPTATNHIFRQRFHQYLFHQIHFIPILETGSPDFYWQQSTKCNRL